MSNKKSTIIEEQLKKGVPEIKPGDTVRIHIKTKKSDKQKNEIFEGVVLAKKHGKGISSTITVRNVISGVGVERIFPIHSPNITKIEVVKRAHTKKSKLYYLREAKGKKKRLKRKEMKKKEIWEKEPKPEKNKSEEEKPDSKKSAEKQTTKAKKPKDKEVSQDKKRNSSKETKKDNKETEESSSKSEENTKESKNKK